MKKIFLLLFIVCICLPLFSQTVENSFRFETKIAEKDYQEYIGKTVIFREPLGDSEKNIKIKANIGKDYIITDIKTRQFRDSFSKNNLEITITFQEVGSSKTVEITAYAEITKKKSIQINQIPVIFKDEYTSAREKNIGKKFVYLENREEYSILDMTIGNNVNIYNYLIPAVKYKCKNIKSNKISFFNATYVDGVLSGKITQSSQAKNLIDGSVVVQDKHSFNELKNSKDIEIWANNVREKGYLDDDKNIKFQYVVPINDTLNINSVIAYSKLWLDNNDKGRFLISDNGSQEASIRTLKGKVNLGIAASHTYFVTVEHFEKIKENLHVWADVIVEFKSNRLRLTYMVCNYDVIYSHNGVDKIPSSLKNYNTKINFHPPFSVDSNKLFWDEGFVNANVFCVNSISELIDYINSSFAKRQEEKEKDLQRQSDNW